MEAFVLAFARPGTPPHDEPYSYDPDRQLNVQADGTPAIRDTELLTAVGNTTSTAGSQTHFDD